MRSLLRTLLPSVSLLGLLGLLGLAGPSSRLAAQDPAPEGDERYAAPEVSDCGVLYEDDLTELRAPDPVPQASLAELEAAHRRRPRNPRRGLALARAYLTHKRYDDAETVLMPFLGRSSPGPDAYAILAALQLGRGEALRAMATAEESTRRFGHREATDFLLGAARLAAGRYETLDDLLEGVVFARAVTRLRVKYGLLHGEMATALLNHEHAYFLGGYAVVDADEVRAIGAYYHGLLQVVAKGDTLAAPAYPDTLAALYHRALYPATAYHLERIGDYPSLLELYAAIHASALRKAASELPPDTPDGTRSYAGTLVEYADAGHLRWLTMARLRELDPRYFNALVCDAFDEWQAVQQNFLAIAWQGGM